ncbi:hypothetical protein FPQ18DRAFT_323546 [Pyronema domesticum]|nr:hypothetical protein FPQ18DRAFT_323546 [Pyronema domesticum]
MHPFSLRRSIRSLGPVVLGLVVLGSWYGVLMVLMVLGTGVPGVCCPVGPTIVVLMVLGSWYVVLLVLVCRPMGPGMSSLVPWVLAVLGSW